jgi:hypothetical protein
VVALVGTDLVQQPGELRRRLARQEADPLCLQLEAGTGRAQILPAQPRAEWQAGAGIPRDGGRPLGGHPDRIDGAAVFQSVFGHLLDRGSHGDRVELHQPGHGHARREKEPVHVLDAGVGPNDASADAAGPHVDHQDADGGPPWSGGSRAAGRWARRD